jgi:patatin-like phospholipase/acyl hydrolase
VGNAGIFCILSLEGGGAKGFYTLGVLMQIEAMAGPLHQQFDLVFGTSLVPAQSSRLLSVSADPSMKLWRSIASTS